ncbi:MAG: NAD/FAD-binding protein [Ponticaulis sp.]|nr:NAD/FAD-binding protein [Ponticaulis sp.]
MNAPRKKIAVIGSGLAGLSAAWALRTIADVEMFESDARVGGHAYTVDVSTDSGNIPVDVGFIVCNDINYPNFMAMLQCLGVETQESDMSFSVSDPDKFEWSSDPTGLFAQKRNFVRPEFWKLLTEILRFNKTAIADAEADQLPHNLTLGEYLDQIGASQLFRDQYIYPMGAAIWSTPEADINGYPARPFIRFFNNHRLMHKERPKWRTVQGGSRSYVNKLIQDLGDRIKTGEPVHQVTRKDGGVDVRLTDRTERFDDVVLACHADQSFRLLGDGFENAASILAPMKTIPNRAVLHGDASLMPKRRAAWASWNVLKGEDQEVTLTYWMNRLQGIDNSIPLFVTLNPQKPPRIDQVHGEFEFTHPLYTIESHEALSRLELVNGRDGLWFAGAWMGNGFHEDALKAGLRVAVSLGATLPWEPVGVKPYLDLSEQVTDEDINVSAVAAQ